MSLIPFGHHAIILTSWYRQHSYLCCEDLRSAIGMFESPNCEVNPQPNTRGIRPLVGRTSGKCRSVMHVLAVTFSITYHFFFICQNIYIRVTWSARETCPLLMYPSIFLIFMYRSISCFAARSHRFEDGVATPTSFLLPSSYTYNYGLGIHFKDYF